jgi:integrase
MPRPRPPYLQRHITRHGKAVWYVRIAKGPRIRIRAECGTSEFDSEYITAVTGAPRPKKGAPATGTLAWLVARYREVGAWTSLSLATRKQRENILKHVLDAAGDKPFVRITRATIVAGCERRSKTPAQARHFLSTMRGLFRWALKADLVKTDPTIGIDNPRPKKGGGFLVWTEDDVSGYEQRWPIGTRQRVWLDVLLYTGLRRGDAVVLGRQHVRNGVATLRTEKSQGEITVTLPILSVLQRTLDAGPTGELAFICGANGKPFTKESFGNEFREACRAAGVPGSPHGVRKIAATRAANAGATVAQLEAIFGWSGGRMASLYTLSADRKRLALDAMSKLANE